MFPRIPVTWRVRSPRLHAALASAFLILVASAPGSAADERVTAVFGANGLNSLQVGGKELLRGGTPQVRSVTLEEITAGPKGDWKYTFETVSGAPRTATFDGRAKRLAQEYAWGAAEFAYTPGPDRLDVAVTLKNTSPRTLADFDLSLLELAFPEAPASWKKGKDTLASSLDNLALVRAKAGDLELLACNLSMTPPFRLGFGKATDPKGLVYPLVVAGGVPALEPGSYAVEPHGLPRIPPGKTLTLELTLACPGDFGAWMKEVAKKFRAAYDPPHAWEDRRPVGMIMTSSSAKEHRSATNPRGWLNNPKLDVTTADGKADFRKRMLAAAETAVKVIKDAGGQGMIVWDVEGQENPHPVSFVGDPRLAKTLAPEMDEIADDYFQTFRKAGLRTGICIRPTQVYFDEAKKKWEHGTGSDGGPGRGDHYPQLRPKDLPWWNFHPVAERLCDKIEYAKKRWGCTLFYVDTNGVHRQLGEEKKFQWVLLEAAIWKQVRAKHPDVLLIPELVKDDHAYHAATWAFAAPYMEVDLKGYGTPASVRALFPEAFSVVNVTDGDLDKNRDAIKEAVGRGDILLFRGWFADKRNAWVKALYDEVKRR